MRTFLFCILFIVPSLLFSQHVYTCKIGGFTVSVERYKGLKVAGISFYRVQWNVGDSASYANTVMVSEYRGAVVGMTYMYAGMPDKKLRDLFGSDYEHKLLSLAGKTVEAIREQLSVFRAELSLGDVSQWIVSNTELNLETSLLPKRPIAMVAIPDKKKLMRYVVYVSGIDMASTVMLLQALQELGAER